MIKQTMFPMSQEPENGRSYITWKDGIPTHRIRDKTNKSWDRIKRLIKCDGWTYPPEKPEPSYQKRLDRDDRFILRGVLTISPENIKEDPELYHDLQAFLDNNLPKHKNNQKTEDQETQECLAFQANKIF